MSPALILSLVMLALMALAMLRPLDHDESQYVAAAVLTAKGALPYRDFTYLQTPLQPLLFAPLAAMLDGWVWPGLRLVNALLAAGAVAGVYVAARRSGAGDRAAIVVALGFAACDILLFSAAMARNDALPAAMLAGALVAMTGRGRGAAFVTGLLLAGAAAAKISYALPAAAYGMWVLFHREHRPAWVALGAVPPALFVAWTWSIAPADFVFGVFTFPAQAPADFYADRPWKMSLAAKAIDTLKFLALGPALLAAMLVARSRVAGPLPWLALAGLVAALLPSPTWRQYLLPVLPPLFVWAAVAIERQPLTRGWRIASAVFALAGLAPSLASLAGGASITGAMRDSRAIGQAMNAAGVSGPVATLSPQFVPAAGRSIDPRFAAGPFAFRIRTFLSPDQEQPRHIVTPRTLTAQFDAVPPGAILTGGEGKWVSGDDRLEQPLAAWATVRGWRRIPVKDGRFVLWVK